MHSTAARLVPGSGRHGAKVGAKRLVLTHIAPGEVDEPATIAALGKVYPGEVIVGRDLMEVPAVGAAATGDRSARRRAVQCRPFVARGRRYRCDRHGSGPHRRPGTSLR